MSSPPMKLPGFHDKKVLYCLRGVSGSGKSTYARNIVEYFGRGEIFSTDDFFYDEYGEYHFDPYELEGAHEWNRGRVKDALNRGVSPILIDNTNLQFWEMRPYCFEAALVGYRCYFLEPPTEWKFKINQLYRKQKHGIPKGKLVAQLERYERNPTVQKVIGPVLWEKVLREQKKNKKKEEEEVEEVEGESVENQLLSELRRGTAAEEQPSQGLDDVIALHEVRQQCVRALTKWEDITEPVPLLPPQTVPALQEICQDALKSLLRRSFRRSRLYPGGGEESVLAMGYLPLERKKTPPGVEVSDDGPSAPTTPSPEQLTEAQRATLEHIRQIMGDIPDSVLVPLCVQCEWEQQDIVERILLENGLSEVSPVPPPSSPGRRRRQKRKERSELPAGMVGRLVVPGDLVERLTELFGPNEGGEGLGVSGDVTINVDQDLALCLYNAINSSGSSCQSDSASGSAPSSAPNTPGRRARDGPGPNLRRLIGAYPGIDEEYLRTLLRSFNGNVEGAIAALNVTPVRVDLAADDYLYSVKAEQRAPTPPPSFLPADSSPCTYYRETPAAATATLLGEKARLYRSQQADKARQAEEWHGRKNGEVAAYYSAEASKLRVRAEEAELSAFEHSTARERLEGLCAGSPSVDLHGCTIAEAKRLTDRAVEAARARGLPCLTLITGKGLHSAGRFPRLKRSLKPHLDAQRLRYNEQEDGFKIRFK